MQNKRRNKTVELQEGEQHTTIPPRRRQTHCVAAAQPAFFPPSSSPPSAIPFFFFGTAALSAPPVVRIRASGGWGREGNREKKTATQSGVQSGGALGGKGGPVRACICERGKDSLSRGALTSVCLGPSLARFPFFLILRVLPLMCPSCVRSGAHRRG